jgi:hypothetical protein
MPLFNIKQSDRIEEEKKVPFNKIKKLHEARWRYDCSLGSVRMRRMTLTDQEETGIRLMEDYPEYRELVEASQPLWKLLEKKIPFSPEQQIAFTELGKKLEPYSHDYYATCFVDVDENGKEFSVLANRTELDAFLFELQPKERKELIDALDMLSNPAVDGKVDTIAFTLAKEFGLKLLPDDLTMENMTAQQASVLAAQLLDSRVGGEE